MFHYMNRGAAFYRNVVRLALPILLQNLCTTLLGLIDTFMVGALGEAPLAAVLVANIPVFVIQLVIFGLQSGSSVLIGQYWGKGDILAVERIFAFVTKVTTVISLIFTLSALLLSGMLMRIFTNDLVLIWRGSLYLRVIAAFVLKLPVLAVYFIISLDEIVKIPVMYLNYKKYRWGKDLTVKSE